VKVSSSYKIIMVNGTVVSS